MCPGDNDRVDGEYICLSKGIRYNTYTQYKYPACYLNISLKWYIWRVFTSISSKRNEDFLGCWKQKFKDWMLMFNLIGYILPDQHPLCSRWMLLAMFAESQWIVKRSDNGGYNNSFPSSNFKPRPFFRSCYFCYIFINFDWNMLPLHTVLAI